MQKGEVRIAKITANPFSDEGDMKNYHHPACIFQTFVKARPSTKIIEVGGYFETSVFIRSRTPKYCLSQSFSSFLRKAKVAYLIQRKLAHLKVFPIA